MEKCLSVVKLELKEIIYIDTEPSADLEYEMVNRPTGTQARCSKLDRLVINIGLSEIFTCDFWIIQKLVEWHFDVAHLIEKGEAIDVNTLDVNPYK